MNGFNKKTKCKFCCKEITIPNLDRHERSCLSNNKNSLNCKNCNKRIITDKKRRINQLFCTSDCFYTYTINNNPNRYKKCVICKKDYVISKNKTNLQRKTCSENCLLELISKNSRENINCGARAGHVLGKKIYHNGILFDSSWELKLAKWLDENKIEWIRDRKLYFKWIDSDNKERRYTPDFFLPKYNLYLDPKNKYIQLLDRYKIKQVRKTHGIKLITGHYDYIIRKIKTLTLY
jgi:hypothetical protein